MIRFIWVGAQYNMLPWGPKSSAASLLTGDSVSLIRLGRSGNCTSRSCQVCMLRLDFWTDYSPGVGTVAWLLASLRCCRCRAMIQLEACKGEGEKGVATPPGWLGPRAQLQHPRPWELWAMVWRPDLLGPDREDRGLESSPLAWFSC